MKLSNIVLSVLLVITGLLLTKVWMQNNDLNNANTELNKKLMEANLEIGRAHTKFGDANKYIKELEDEIQKEIKEREGFITRIGKLEAELKAHGEGSGTTVVTIIDEKIVEVPAELSVLKGQLYQALENNKIVLVSSIMGNYKDFRLDIKATVQPKEGSVDLPINFEYDLHQKFRGIFVEDILPSGAINNYFSFWEVDDNGKTVTDIRLTNFQVIINDKRKPKLYWWCPRLDVSAFLDVSGPLNVDHGIDMGLSLSAYGKTPNDLTWRFLRLGIGVGDDISLSLTPVLYNLGQPLPLLTNAWLGAGIQRSLMDPLWKYQFSLGVMF